MTRSRQQAQFFAALDSLGAAGGSNLVENAGTVGLDSVFGNEKLGGDLAIAEAAGDQGEDFELACGDAERLLVGGIRSEGDRAGNEGGGGFRGNKHFLYHDRFPNGFATARDAEAEPDAEGREEDGDQRAVELDGVLDDDEAVFGVLEGGDEKAADKTEDEDVAFHDGVVKKYIPAHGSRLYKQYSMKSGYSDASFIRAQGCSASHLRPPKTPPGVCEMFVTSEETQAVVDLR
jgi:hypothetical protein